MLPVKPVKRDVMDAWPIAESGLPVRVVNSVTAAGVSVVGDLRSWTDQELIALRSLGRISLGHIHSFFRLCNHIEQGRQGFQTIQDVFTIFLDGPELQVLSARYGFARPELKASRNWATLQEIGDAQHKTRERIRQVEETAGRKLRSRLATVCLQPFVDYFCDVLAANGKSATCEDLASLRTAPHLANLNPCSVLLLLSDANPARIVFYRGFFTLLAEGTIQRVESEAIRLLDTAGAPLALDRLLTALPPVPGADDLAHKRKALLCALDHSPDIAAVTDGRYFLYRNGTRPFLMEMMKSLPLPAHYRAVTAAFNERVRPRSRKGAGFILEVLNTIPQCSRVDRGIYDLKAD